MASRDRHVILNHPSPPNEEVGEVGDWLGQSCTRSAPRLAGCRDRRLWRGKMVINLQCAPEADAKLPTSSVPAPCVRVRQVESGQVVEPVLKEGTDLDD